MTPAKFMKGEAHESDVISPKPRSYMIAEAVYFEALNRAFRSASCV